ncbi:MAG: ATP-binding cassette domain-containing protein [Candidatus Riflebacteria bacterium]|nr:ATP-binding cassette domain-containing protein [Candidatus Riflebacteria bacterium]
MKRSFISCENLTVGYLGNPLIKEINCQINFNDNIGLIGANGSGKTTFLKTLLGLLRPLSGSVELSKECTVSYMSQMSEIEDLMPFSVYEIVEMGLCSKTKPWLSPSRLYKAEIEEALENTSMAEHSKKLFSKLSGGQKQRALLAQALAPSPDVLLLDEPTRGLDVNQRANFMQLLAKLKKKQGLTVILVSHIFEDFEGMDFDIYAIQGQRLTLAKKLSKDINSQLQDLIESQERSDSHE